MSAWLLPKSGDLSTLCRFCVVHLGPAPADRIYRPSCEGLSDRYWMNRLRTELFGTMPRSASSSPLRRLRVRTHRS